jgi:hypothetical protein
MCQIKNEKKLNRIQKADKLIDINIDKLEIEKPILFSSIFKGFKLLPLETKEECLIGNINQLELSDDTLYILDSNITKALLLFDNAGMFIKKIGHIGKGPGEYSQPTSFTIDNQKKQIQILDTQQSKVIIFSTQGKFINEIKLNKGNLCPIQIATQNGITYIDQLFINLGNVDYLLYGINNLGEIKSKWLSNKIYCKGFKQPFNMSSIFFKTENDIKYSKSLFDTIFSVKENKLSPFLVISTKNKLTAEDISTMNQFKDSRQFVNYYYRICKKFMGITNYIETNKLISFRFRSNNRNYNIFYWPENKELHGTSSLIDDLTHQEVISNFYTTSRNHFISIIQNDTPGSMESFIKNIRDNKILLSEKERSKLVKITPNNNPIIVVYECNEKF